MSNLKLITLIVAAVAVMATSVYAGYSMSESKGGAGAASLTLPNGSKSAVNSASTMALPSKTNNAWEMEKFTLVGLDGKMHSLDEWKGKVILLNFWATWCAPCQAEIRDFVKYQEQYREQGLQVLGLGLDEERKLRNVYRTLEMNYPVLITDPEDNRDLMLKWGNSTGIVPYTVVINRDGRMKYIHRGQLDHQSFEEYVLPLLSKG
ncbi:MAG: TlpA family protein disulfide reductase [Chromatiales bacterium]|nr:TlpA family protein disulfide reductase [Chromatiales bacterium]